MSGLLTDHSFFKCPISGQRLRPADGADMSDLVSVSADGGSTVSGMRADAYLVSEDRKIWYPVIDDIICLLPAGALTTRDSGIEHRGDAISESVRSFYDKVGWTADDAGIFEDAARFEDLRPVSADYIRKCHARILRHIAGSGDMLLDVASGPVQYDAYLEYHRQYKSRVCVDISVAALRAAKARLGQRGLYVLGDIANLPFQAEVFDAVVSLHTIYHVPFERQEMAFGELHRVLKQGRTAAVVYSWGNHSVIRRLLRLPKTLSRSALRLSARMIRLVWPAQPGRPPAVPEPLYSHQASPDWFLSRNWPFSWEVACWRSVDVEAMKVLIHSGLLGRRLLQALYTIEERWPRRFGFWGQYPIIEIKKKA